MNGISKRNDVLKINVLLKRRNDVLKKNGVLKRNVVL